MARPLKLNSSIKNKSQLCLFSAQRNFHFTNQFVCAAQSIYDLVIHILFLRKRTDSNRYKPHITGNPTSPTRSEFFTKRCTSSEALANFYTTTWRHMKKVFCPQSPLWETQNWYIDSCNCSLFNKTINNSRYIACNDFILVNNKFERMWMEAVLGNFQVLSQKLFRSTKNRLRHCWCVGRISNRSPSEHRLEEIQLKLPFPGQGKPNRSYPLIRTYEGVLISP